MGAGSRKNVSQEVQRERKQREQAEQAQKAKERQQDKASWNARLHVLEVGVVDIRLEDYNGDYEAFDNAVAAYFAATQRSRALFDSRLAGTNHWQFIRRNSAK